VGRGPDDLVRRQQARRDLSSLGLGGRGGWRDDEDRRGKQRDQQEQRAGAADACDGDTPRNAALKA
jgi:hypothetical protein